MSQEQIQRVPSNEKNRCGKIVINIGVGKSGDPLEKAKHALQELTARSQVYGEQKIALGILVSIRENQLGDGNA